jgi:FixJ family two-component response regulator
MSGPQLIDCLTDLYPQIGALFISGYVEVPFAPPDGKPFLRKPFSPADLVRTVYQAMGEQGNGHAQSEGQAWRSQ